MEGIKTIIASKSKTFFTFCFCFLLGVGIFSIYNFTISLSKFYLASFILVAFLIAFWGNKAVRFVVFCLIITILGAVRYQLAFPFQKVNEGKQTVTAYITIEPDIRQDSVRYIVKTQEEKPKRLYVKGGLYPRYNYGDVLKLGCDIKKPEPIVDEATGESFRYDMYLARYGVFAVCNEPYIEKIGEREANPLMRGLLQGKAVVAAKINQLWHEPYASFMAGILYGYRGGLGKLNDLFSKTGVSHIVAVSGFNITIIAQILIALFVLILIPRKKAFWLVVSGIILFVLFTGASASVVRAGVMGVIALLAKQMGRLSRMGNVLILAAALMTLHNPFVLIWDAGFQLSFLATVGLVYLSPLIEEYFAKLPEVIKEPLVSTLSAIIITLPLILFQFGRLSVVAPVVNILILWMIPYLMLFGAVAVFLGFVVYPIGQVIAWVTWIGMEYIVRVVTWFAELPFSAVDMKIPAWVMVVSYAIMIYWIINRTRIQRIERIRTDSSKSV